MSALLWRRVISWEWSLEISTRGLGDRGFYRYAWYNCLCTGNCISWFIPLVHFIGVNVDDVTLRRTVRHFEFWYSSRSFWLCVTLGFPRAYLLKKEKVRNSQSTFMLKNSMTPRLHCPPSRKSSTTSHCFFVMSTVHCRVYTVRSHENTRQHLSIYLLPIFQGSTPLHFIPPYLSEILESGSWALMSE